MDRLTQYECHLPLPAAPMLYLSSYVSQHLPGAVEEETTQHSAQIRPAGLKHVTFYEAKALDALSS